MRNQMDVFNKPCAFAALWVKGKKVIVSGRPMELLRVKYERS